MNVFGSRPPREPAAVERFGCIACGRIGTRTEPTGLDDGTTSPACVDATDCRLHAEKVGTYGAL